jgi:hypothetical protein
MARLTEIHRQQSSSLEAPTKVPAGEPLGVRASSTSRWSTALPPGTSVREIKAAYCCWSSPSSRTLACTPRPAASMGEDLLLVVNGDGPYVVDKVFRWVVCHVAIVCRSCWNHCEHVASTFLTCCECPCECFKITYKYFLCCKH